MTEEDFETLMLLVSPQKRERIRKFRFFRDASNTLIGELLIRMEICKRTGLQNDQLNFSTTAHGKPFLVNNQQIQFNISHSGNYVVAAIDDKQVGIDVELKKPIDLKIAERFFSADETAYVFSHPTQSENVCKAFFEIWTKKESLIKWDGQGMSKSLSSFSVLQKEDDSPHYFCVFENDTAICHVCTMQMNPPPLNLILLETLLSWCNSTVTE